MLMYVSIITLIYKKIYTYRGSVDAIIRVCYFESHVIPTREFVMLFSYCSQGKS